MRWKRRRFSKKTLFVVLMATSLLLMLVPERFTHPLKNPLQLLAPFQWAVHDTTATAIDAVRNRFRQPVSPAEYDRTEAARRALENRIVAIETELAETRRSLGAATGWRGRGLKPDVRLIPARVVSGDSVGWRESLLIDRGTSDGVEPGDWVVSHGDLPSAAQGRPVDAELLASECLLGRVTDTSPLTSRVVLLTDPKLEPPVLVRVARIEKGRLTVTETTFALTGAGDRHMAVTDVPVTSPDGWAMRPGDLVVSSPGEPRLPISVVIGQIQRIEPNPRNPLLCRLVVSPRRDGKTVRRVFVVDAP